MKFIVKEAWLLLDQNGDKKVKLTQLEGYIIPNLVDKDAIKGGYGNISFDKKYGDGK
jgi:hypothetical protein